jgi:Lysylphosphatidylglycerol synthase TM region
MPRALEAGAVTPKLALKIALSLVVGGVCVYFAAKGVKLDDVVAGMRVLSASGIALFLATCAVTHFFRAWRWEFLLRPIGVSLPMSRLLPISSAGFMAILALPVRLGEFVRPYFVTRERPVGMSALLGTVAVERIIDGLLISILFFVSYLVSPSGSFTPALRIAAWISLLGFVGLTTFLALARVWKEQTIAFALRASLLQWLAPKLARKVGDRLHNLISATSPSSSCSRSPTGAATDSACGSSRAKWGCRSRSARRTRRWPSRASSCRSPTRRGSSGSISSASGSRCSPICPRPS